MKKRGASPLIATVLIIGMVVAASAVVFLWGKGYTEDIIEKGQSASLSKLSCVTDIEIDILRHDGSFLTVENRGRGKVDRFTIVEDGIPHEVDTEIEPGAIAQIDYSGNTIEVIPKIRIAQGLFQPCSEKKIKYVV